MAGTTCLSSESTSAVLSPGTLTAVITAGDPGEPEHPRWSQHALQLPFDVYQAQGCGRSSRSPRENPPRLRRIARVSDPVVTGMTPRWLYRSLTGPLQASPKLDSIAMPFAGTVNCRTCPQLIDPQADCFSARS